MSSYLWVKAFHIVFVASWFAGLFYLPRLFVNLAQVPPDSTAERDRLLLMARKLLRFTRLLMWPRAWQVSADDQAVTLRVTEDRHCGLAAPSGPTV